MSNTNECQNINNSDPNMKVIRDNYQRTSESNESNFVHEICENTDVEITALTFSDFNINRNNTYNRRSAELIQINPENCVSCDLKIYPMERLANDGKLYHKNCFRCSKCKTILSRTNFNISNNLIYCKTHFLELFKIRGRYDDDDIIENEIITPKKGSFEEIPTTDTRGLVEKFRMLETGSVPSSNSNDRQIQIRFVQPDDDIVRSQDMQQDELPPPETAKTMVAKFRALETESNIPTPEHFQQMQYKVKASLSPRPSIRHKTNTVIINQNSVESNSPEELPEEGMTKNLLNKFQSMLSSP